ncbi:MAG: His/Gly/Thr/Pro-type tRNA ligase C-terminal domain-containing protein, partial [Gemmatimonadota bacterium]|nr:His/Gly/Thr/Pro-type tRNA ligase C-terminal domain-containing protein [Gemmatimonadota bacterium]
ALARREETRTAADEVFKTLVAAGIEVLYDDRRDASPGVKFNDADLRGLPIRVVVGERSLKAGGAELKLRTGEETRIVPLDELVPEIRDELARLEAKLLL